MSIDTDGISIDLACRSCGCLRQVRTQIIVKEPISERMKTACTYLKAVCPACSTETEYLVFMDPGWSIEDHARQTIACPCGNTSFRSIVPLDHTKPDLNPSSYRGTILSFYEVACRDCGNESMVIIFHGTDMIDKNELKGLS